jgi:hypothetical protein
MSFHLLIFKFNKLSKEDWQLLGVLGGLVLSCLTILLNAFAIFKNTSALKLQNSQEITKSHRELWKLTIKNPEKFKRILELKIDLLEKPITYEENRFVHLLLLHMSSTYMFYRKNYMEPIEQLKFDFDDFLSFPIPREVWLQSKHFFNNNFVRFVNSKDKSQISILLRFRKLRPEDKLSFKKRWKILILSSSPDKISETILKTFKDELIYMNDKDEVVSKEFIKLNKIDFIICFGYGRILKEPILGNVTAINIHTGMLPYNRGANPNLWSWLQNTAKGITIHYIDEGIDTGDIIAQSQVIMPDNTSIQSSYDLLISEAYKLFDGTWPLIRAGKNERNRQKGSGSYYTLKDQLPLKDLLDQNGLNMPIEKFIEIARERLKDSV